MKRRLANKNSIPAVFLMVTVVLLCGNHLFPTHRAEKRTRPNAILIVIDTLRADHMSTYGYFRKTTPHIDALAAESVVFENALASAPWTTPSIASLMTSREPAALGFIGEDPVQLDASAATMADVFKLNRYITKGIVSHDFVGTKLKFDRGFDSFDQSNAKGYGTVSSPAVSAAAVSFAKEHVQDEFFLFLHYFDPHFDYILHPEFDFDPNYRGSIRSGEFKDSLLAKAPTMTAGDRAHLEALYDSEIRFTDEHIGRFLDELKSLGLYDSSLIILAADHGEEFSERADHWIGHTKSLYQDLIHVPLIVKLPGGAAHRRVEEPIGLIDVMPTIVSHLGLKTPRAFACEGRNVDLTGNAAPESRPVFGETRRWAKLQSVVWKGWKLIYDAQRETQELYDLNADAGETKDLAAAHPKECGELRALLWGWRAEMARIASGIRIEPKKAAFNDAETARLRSLGYVK